MPIKGALYQSNIETFSMFRYNIIATILLLICLLCQEGSAFSVPHHQSSSSINNINKSTHLSVASQDNDDMSSRREWTRNILTSIIATTPLVVSAADSGDTIWKTGKSPQIPGQKPKDKSDTKGTRKDPSFLRSISDCKGKCENSPGPDGLARSSTECLSACQDICCTTYEQCTFAIVPRL